MCNDTKVNGNKRLNFREREYKRKSERTDVHAADLHR